MRTTDVLILHSPVQSEPPAPGCHGGRSNDGEPVVTVPLPLNGCLAARCPGASQHGLQHEAALTEKHDAAAPATGVFLYRATAPCLFSSHK